MNNKTLMAVEIGILLVALALIASPVMAAAGPGISVSGWNTQSYRSFAPIKPTFTYSPSTSSVYTSSPPAYLYDRYSNLNSYLGTSSISPNTNTITVPSTALSNNDWNSLFVSPGFMYSCGCS